VRKADKPYHRPVPLSYLGTLNFWNPLGHSRPVAGLLYPFFKFNYIFANHVAAERDVSNTANTDAHRRTGS
jgi:hypothetical protein